MAATKAEIRDDVILRLTQGNPSSSFEIPDAQIDRWIDIARDEIVGEYVLKATKLGGLHDIDPVYIEQASSISLTVAAGGGHRATFTNDILSIPPNDAALIQLQLYHTPSDTYTKAYQMDIFSIKLAEEMEFTAPSSDKPVFYRVGAQFYIKGLGSITVGDYQVQIEYIQGMTGGANDYNVADNHVKAITEMAEELGRRELGMSLIDEVNDDTQNK